ncbi:MAG: 23S rRNA (pseudouridine(1915)-N(3))-methyltransferase RlmH [Clostridia bacterium]|nr:23S rRNA (pseudouridine(1915)-N(3))-methyltransferase RlmH [Clostridia bacterium]
MATIKFITVGTLKEEYLREAVKEYEKRLSGFCHVEQVNLKEAKLPNDPSEGDIKRALAEESRAILAAMSERSYKIAMCVEGKQFSSEELAAKLESAFSAANEICFVIGSSHGLDDSVKNAADLKLSVSKMTFPHQLMRVLLLEGVYRCMNIIKGTKYHK